MEQDRNTLVIRAQQRAVKSVLVGAANFSEPLFRALLGRMASREELERYDW